MRLLLATLKPTVDKLQLWAEEGSLEDAFNELPIRQGKAPTICIPGSALIITGISQGKVTGKGRLACLLDISLTLQVRR